MKIKVISEFQDIYTREMRVVGVEMDVDEARGKDLLKRKLAEEVVIPKEEKSTEEATDAEPKAKSKKADKPEE